MQRFNPQNAFNVAFALLYSTQIRQKQRLCCTNFYLRLLKQQQLHHIRLFSKYSKYNSYQNGDGEQHKSYHYYDNHHDRIRMLRQQQIDIEKLFHYEQLLGLQRTITTSTSVPEAKNVISHTSTTCSKIQKNYTMKELHTAYINAAKRCHPDSQQHHYNNNNASITTTAEEQFILVTNAYEYLKEQYSKFGTSTTTSSTVTNGTDTDSVTVQVEQEQYYRQECMNVLGQPAEIVEESKRCPLFRQWLFGRTDAAYYWQSFLMIHGGLAPYPLRDSNNHFVLLNENNNNNATTTKHEAITSESQPIRRRRRH